MAKPLRSAPELAGTGVGEILALGILLGVIDLGKRLIMRCAKRPYGGNKAEDGVMPFDKTRSIPEEFFVGEIARILKPAQSWF